MAKPNTVRAFMLFEAATYIVAALIDSGIFIAGYEHSAARIAESVIAVVLLAGVVSAWIRPVASRVTGLTARGFALLGTLAGVFTIIIGMGPRTVPDAVYHVCIIIVMVFGLVVTARVMSPVAAAFAEIGLPASVFRHAG